MTLLPIDARWWMAPLLTLLLFVGIWGETRAFHAPSGDATAYHALVRASAANLPYRFGDWEGDDIPLPQAAVTLLKPNVLLGRRFENARTGEHVTLLLVQCRDARDMGGHYPPICYPAHGWALREKKQAKVHVDGRTASMMVYRFTFESPERFSEHVIYSFFILPNGRIDSGRDGVDRVAADARAKLFGAAQLQVVFDGSMSEERRNEVFGELVSLATPVIETIRAGGKR